MKELMIGSREKAVEAIGGARLALADFVIVSSPPCMKEFRELPMSQRLPAAG
jgi:hypothetical protein